MKLILDHVMQLKVTLKNTKPPIWRRILVPCTYSFWDLHVAIQDAMGWFDQHLHQFTLEDPFELDAVRIGIPDEGSSSDDSIIIPGWELPIAAFFTLLNREALYEYDFGDSWLHSVVLEKIFPYEEGQDLPACIGGRRACPPEDCGGVPGYEGLLEILADPEHEQHEETLQWLGGPFDPAAFNRDQVVFEDPHERWHQAFG